MENLLTGHQGADVFSCCFCGGDHGATECMASLCPNCFKSVCEHQQEPDERVNSAEAIKSIDDCITDIVPADDWDELENRFPTELPIELFAHVVATYRIPDHLAFLNDLFSVALPCDGSQWNRSRKHGNCYKFCYAAQQDEANKIRQLAGTDSDISVVQGFVRGRTGAYVGHCWLELAERVIDCGTHRKKFTVYDRVVYYSDYRVTHAKRYTADEARIRAFEAGHYGRWGEPPDDLPMQERQIRGVPVADQPASTE